MIDADRAEVRRYQDLEALNLLDGVNYAFSPRKFGNMAFPYSKTPDEVIANRKRFLAASGIELENVVFMLPVHKVNIEVVGKEDRGRGALEKGTVVPSTDALITTDTGVALALNAADCAPVIVTNRRAEFLALYHAGREGTDLQIGRIVIAKLRQMGFTDPENFIVGIGPIIGKCCYTQQYVQTRNPRLWSDYLIPTEGRWLSNNVESIEGSDSPLYKITARNGSKLRLDLAGMNWEQLVRSGVHTDNISKTSICTACEAEKGSMFSHVVTALYAGTQQASEFPEGRFMAVAQLLQTV